jgi:hypothetical protein
MSFIPVVTTVQLLSQAITGLKNARDLAKESGNRELIEKIGDAYNIFSDLKERILDLQEENRVLKEQLAKRDSCTGPVPPFGYVYKTDDADRAYPLCPKCYQEKQGHVSYLARQKWGDGYNIYCGCGWSFTHDGDTPEPIRSGVSRRDRTCRFGS